MTEDLFYFRQSAAGRDEPLVFLPGWGFSGKIAELLPCLAGRPLIYPRSLIQPASLVSQLAAFLRRYDISRIIALGWSMGANLALDFALEYPGLVGGLHLLAMRGWWPAAEIAAIRAELAADREKFLKNFYRKCFLGHKKEYSLFVREMEAGLIAGAEPELLRAGLDYLAAYRLPEDKKICGVNVDLTLYHGQKDIIAPVAGLPRPGCGQCRIISHGGHMFFLDADFVLRDGRGKEAVRRKFSRAAATYDKYADVQKDTAIRLAGILPRSRFDKILEIGCGTGNYTRLLLDKFPQAAITALDFSRPMVEQAEKKIKSTQVEFLCADGEDYLIADKKFDLITSNGALQWFNRPQAAFARIAERLAPDGRFTCSIFGPGTLKELENGFAEVLDNDLKPAAASFLTKKQLKEALLAVFPLVEITELRLSREYDSLLDLLRHLRKTGTAGFQPAGPRLTRGLIKKLDSWFAARNGYIVTYQIFLITCRRK